MKIKFAVVGSVAAIVVALIPASAGAGRPYEVTVTPYAYDSCYMSNYGWYEEYLPPEPGPRCYAMASNDEMGHGSGETFIDGARENHGNADAQIFPNLSFVVPRPVDELPIELRVRVNSARADVQGSSDALTDASDAWVQADLWLQHTPQGVCGPNGNLFLGREVLVDASPGQPHVIDDSEVVFNLVLRSCNAGESMPAGTYEIALLTWAGSELRQLGDMVSASFDVDLVEVRIAGHRAFGGR